MKTYLSLFVIAIAFSITVLFLNSTTKELKYFTENDPTIVIPPYKILIPTLTPNVFANGYISINNSITV